MSQEVRALEPQALWNNFADLNEVPRPSKKEERVIAFIKKFGEDLGLDTYVDPAGNVIIRKPASPGMEDRTPVIMQSHLDMVCVKNKETIHDFDNEGIKMLVNDDWVKADGTTLGSDNGLGVASIMTILASKEIAHPPLEGLFTIDEETGMTGAIELEDGILNGKILFNLDTEDDDELTIGCAGGIDITAHREYTEEATPANHAGKRLTLKGLSGGHSGMDINKGLGNANKLMNRILKVASRLGARVADLEGGGLRNAIPRESFAVIAVPKENSAALDTLLGKVLNEIKAEHGTTDPELQFTIENVDAPSSLMNEEAQRSMLAAIYACPVGIYRMSPDVKDLVQTSNNLARVQARNGHFEAQCLCRSSVDSEKFDEAEAIRAAFELMGAQVEFTGSYPGWTPNPSAPIIKTMEDLYKEMFNEDPHVMACHAGLECGLIGEHYPDVEMISFGPNIRGAHSPDEMVQISSVQKYWGFLLETLKRVN